MIHDNDNIGNKIDAKMRIPSSLMNKKKKRWSHRDIANMLQLQNNPELIELLNTNQQQQQQQQQQQSNDYNNDSINDNGNNNNNNLSSQNKRSLTTAFNYSVIGEDAGYNNKRQRKISQSYQSNIIHKKRPKKVQIDDFVTSYLIKWSLDHLINASSIFLSIIFREEENDCIEPIFSSNHMIKMNDPETNQLKYVPFMYYYHDVYINAITIYYDVMNNKEQEKQEFNDEEKEENLLFSQNHITQLLRACFLISFMYDERIKRFVMSDHSIHRRYLLSKPPEQSKIELFINSTRHFIDDFIIHDCTNIIDMTQNCIKFWVSICIQNNMNIEKELDQMREIKRSGHSV